MIISQRKFILHKDQSSIWRIVFFQMLLLFFFHSCTKESNPNLIEKKKIDSLYQKAAKHVNEGKDEKAFYEFNLAKDGYLNNKDSIWAARCLTEMAIIQEYSGDNLGSIETSIAAIKLLHENEKDHYELLFDNYINLGTNSTSLKNYNEAEKLYLKSLAFVQEDIQRLRSMHNLAIVYFKKKEFKRAHDIQNLVVYGLSQDNENYYKALINQSRYHWHDQSNYSPIENFRAAEKHYKAIEDPWGLSATYCYLSEYYEDKKSDSALYFAKKMYEVSKKLKSPTDELEALENIIKYDPQPQKYFVKFSKISDSIAVHGNKSRNQFAIIRYESEKNLSDNLKLEKDISQKNVLLFFVALLLVSTTTGGYIWLRARKKKIKLIADNKIKEERLSTSKKVHDVVANGLYQMMSALEHQEDLEKNELMDQLEKMYQKSRDISYDGHLPLAPDYIKEQISEVAETFQNENLQVFVIGNEDRLWKQVPQKIHNDLYIIIQELFINSKKHGNASRIVLKFELKNEKLEVNFNDNGEGIFNQSTTLGNGLKHLLDRIKKHNGTLTIPDHDTKIKGFKINFNFPIR